MQFTSWTFTQRAIDSGLVPSMGSVGDYYHNAMIESFWSPLQVEILDRKGTPEPPAIPGRFSLNSSP